MHSYWQPVNRAKPLLGTTVSIALQGLSSDVANGAITQCFDKIEHIHRCMSFQDPGSDVSRLNRGAHAGAIQVDQHTYDVLSLAADISERSGGTFDVTVSPSLSTAWQLREPGRFAVPDESARWSDIELLPRRHVRFARSLIIDLSGIAKGYAVDQALAVLSAHTPSQACVNAGGDLAVCGSESARVRLDAPLDDAAALPVVEIKNGCLASSGPRDEWSAIDERDFVDGALRRTVPARFVSVLARRCAVADALTKVVMAQGTRSSAVLQHYTARALLSDQPTGWLEVA